MLQFVIVCYLHKNFNEGCPVGYFGSQCQTPCPFPLYGQFCQTWCNCERSECNNIEGCPFTKGAGETYVFDWHAIVTLFLNWDKSWFVSLKQYRVFLYHLSKLNLRKFDLMYLFFSHFWITVSHYWILCPEVQGCLENLTI